MTQINLMLADQRLIVAQKVKIAAGDINSVVLHADFDAAWDEFTNRKVIFANDSVNGGKTQDILLIGDECIVPHEVLAKEGVLLISVDGYTTDGTTRKTSSIAKMKVSESLADATTTVAPTMDLYMQYLAAMDSKTAPLFNAYKAEMDAYKAEMDTYFAEKVAEMETIARSTEGVVLWENPDTLAEFTGQTVALNLTEYKRIRVLFCGEANGLNTNYHEWEFSTKDVLYTVHSPLRLSGGVGGRKLTITNSGINFENGKDTSNDVENLCCIPAKIIGYKFL